MPRITWKDSPFKLLILLIFPHFLLVPAIFKNNFNWLILINSPYKENKAHLMSSAFEGKRTKYWNKFPSTMARPSLNFIFFFFFFRLKNPRNKKKDFNKSMVNWILNPRKSRAELILEFLKKCTSKESKNKQTNRHAETF